MKRSERSNSNYLKKCSLVVFTVLWKLCVKKKHNMRNTKIDSCSTAVQNQSSRHDLHRLSHSSKHKTSFCMGAATAAIFANRSPSSLTVIRSKQKRCKELRFGANDLVLAFLSSIASKTCFSNSTSWQSYARVTQANFKDLIVIKMYHVTFSVV